jgi:hypothetical protein
MHEWLFQKFRKDVITEEEQKKYERKEKKKIRNWD